MPIQTGTRLGPYEITGTLGEGGMGEVYRARDTRLGRDVAIKVLPSYLSSDPRIRERFAQEARMISSLSHPHICALFDVGDANGIDYLVMELVDGRTLADVIASGPLPLDQVVRYGVEIAEAVAKAHGQGIVHRDLKPGNIMLTKSGVKVLDFGLAKAEASGLGPRASVDPTEHKPLTEAGTVLGTIQYMAPEQLEGKSADARSDIFALGVILYEIASGRHAFEASSRTSTIAAILESDPPPLPASLPPALDHLIRRCIAKDPDERFQSARDVAFALQDIAHPGQPAKQKASFVPIAAAAVIPVLIAIGGWLFVRRSASNTASGPRTIVVLPFANMGADRSRDFLLLAIPDEITTILTYSPGLSVRPFSASRTTRDLDPQEAGKKLDAAEIVGGHLMDENGKLVVTLESIDAANNKLRWRDAFEVQSADLVTMRRELSDRIRTGLLPKLTPGAQIPERSAPKNGQAYAMYLRASAMATDPEPNREALQLLETAVKIDPDYAPAWAALSARAHADYYYGEAGKGRLDQAREAGLRALALDPDLITAAVRFVIMRTDDGEAAAGLNEAKRLVARRPESADAHFAMSYPLRYGGSLQESAAECNAAYAIDPRNQTIRSCAFTFLELGQYDRARVFTHIDAASQWSRRVDVRILAYQGKYEEAFRTGIPGADHDLLNAFITHAPAQEIDNAVQRMIDIGRGITDGELLYHIGAYVSLAGRPARALQLLNESVRVNHCTVPAIDHDPLYANVRALAEYAEFHQRALQCREKFLAETH